MRHRWFAHRKFRPLVTCINCGGGKRADKQNGPCRGKIRVELRENRVAERNGNGT